MDTHAVISREGLTLFVNLDVQSARLLADRCDGHVVTNQQAMSISRNAQAIRDAHAQQLRDKLAAATELKLAGLLD